jgi:Collagen triple helix repeat (20 copies)
MSSCATTTNRRRRARGRRAGLLCLAIGALSALALPFGATTASAALTKQAIPVLEKVSPGAGCAGTQLTLTGRNFGEVGTGTVITTAGVFPNEMRFAAKILSAAEATTLAPIFLNLETTNVEMQLVTTKGLRSNRVTFALTSFITCFAGGDGTGARTGSTGPTGPSGPTGPTGLNGVTGATGPKGATGPEGKQGPTGPTAPVRAENPIEVAPTPGPTGPTGREGSAGATGPAGRNGATGEAGPAGEAGQTGATGAMGPQGDQGSTGAQGVTGATGPTGATGEQGVTGPPGAPGKTITGPTGPTPSPGPTGPEGPKGATGPAGPEGAKGATGLKGVTGEAGTTGPTGPAGRPGATGPTAPEPEPASCLRGGSEHGFWSTSLTTPPKGPQVEALAAISYPRPLCSGEQQPVLVYVNESQSEEPQSGCGGPVGARTAEPGFLCVFRESDPAVREARDVAAGFSFFEGENGVEESSSPSGEFVVFRTVPFNEEGPPATVGASGAKLTASGSWVVTAR